MLKRHIVFYYPSMGLGGQQTQIMQIAKALNEMGHHISWLYSFNDDLKSEVELYCHVKKLTLPRFNQSRYGIIRIVNRFLYYNLLELYLTKYVINNKVDAVIVSNSIDSRVVNQLSRKKLTKHFRYIGGSMAQVEPHLLASYRKDKTDQFINGYFGFPAAFDELRGQGVPDSKFIDFPFAVNTEKFYPLDKNEVRSFRNQLGISDSDTVIGWVGRVSLNMQLWDTVKLGRILKDRGANGFKLLFVGGGPDFDVLKKQIEDYQLGTYCIVTGWIPYSEINHYINAMDIVPLLEPDPHGGSIVREAMACGRLAISVLGPSATQAVFMKPDATILVNTDNYLMEAVDRVEQLIGKQLEIDTYGVNARKYVAEHLTFKSKAEVIVKAIDSMQYV